jgi:hypothetical protein
VRVEAPAGAGEAPERRGARLLDLVRARDERQHRLFGRAERRRVAADPGALRVEGGAARDQHVERIGRAVPHVRMACDERQRAPGPRAADVDGGMRRLDRTRQARQAGEHVVRAGERDDLVGEEAPDDRERLVERRGSLGLRAERHARLAELGRVRAAAEPQVQAAAAHVVERDGHLGDERRMAERVREDEVPDPDALGHGGERRRRRPCLERRHARQRRRIEMVHQPQRVDPGAVAFDHARAKLLPRERDLREVNADVHPLRA